MTAETPTPLTDALIEQLNIEPWLSLSTKCAELEAHARQLERRCAELERKNAEVMLTDQGRLRSKLASYEGQLAELRRDRERLLGAIEEVTDEPTSLAKIRRAQEVLRNAMRDSRTGNGEEL